MLDTTTPADGILVRDIPSFLRIFAENVNKMVADYTEPKILNKIDATNNQANNYVCGVNLLDAPFEIVVLAQPVNSTLALIAGGTAGYIKIFVFQSNITILNTGNIRLAGGDMLSCVPEDIIILQNVNGNRTVFNNGTWVEILRCLKDV